MLNRLVFSLALFGASIAAAQYREPATPKSGAQKPAPTGCPWLTQGTAATALGGDVTATVNATENASGAFEGSCKFSREPGSPDFLEIHVSKAALPTCPAGSMELKGIGNEAARCSPPGSHGHSVEMISSRVRDVNFTVTLAAHKEKSGAKSDDPQNDELEQVAEAVAGSLY